VNASTLNIASAINVRELRMPVSPSCYAVVDALGGACV
jgi:hypothetical protein